MDWHYWRYKPGDKVRVIDHFVKEHEYHMVSGPGCGCTTTVKWSYEERSRLAGSIVTISEYCDNERYQIKETGCRMNWTDEMFVGLADNECYCESLL